MVPAEVPDAAFVVSLTCTASFYGSRLNANRQNLNKLKHKQKKKNKREKKMLDNELIESDENFAFIVGYTSGGAPYGLTHEQMIDILNEEIREDQYTDSNEDRQD